MNRSQQRCGLRGSGARPAGGRRGYTLVELTVSILVLLVGLAAASQLIQDAAATAKSMEWRQHAVAVAEEVLMRLRQLPFEELTAAPTRQGQTLNLERPQRRPHDYGWTAEIAPLSDTLAQVTIHVSWSDAKRAHRFSASTLLAKEGTQ